MKQRFYSLLFLFPFAYLKIKNRNKKKIFVYTDSRGYDVIGRYHKSPFGSYVFPLCRDYNITYRICPEKFTTIVDFLEAIGDQWSHYDYVIMHCGIVDFSPRPLSNIEKVKESKKAKKAFDNLFAKNQSYYQQSFPVKYYDEYTTTIYSREFLDTEIAPGIKKIKNLVWIDSNPFVPGWDGNFKKGRPSNIGQVVLEFENILAPHVAHRISLKSWTDKMVQENTIDNIHFTKKGFQLILSELKSKINHEPG